MKSIIRIAFVLGFCTCISAQGSSYLVAAQKGDGIFSILRKEGLDPAIYFADFIELNLERIKDSHELKEGEWYHIPLVESSYKSTGVQLTLPDGDETPLFEDELFDLRTKSNRLENAVYYLIPEQSNKDVDQAEKNSFAVDVTKDLAKELMSHGAQVYLIMAQEEGNASVTRKLPNNVQESVEEPVSERSTLNNYVAAVNNRYLKHRGKYQRVLIVKSEGQIRKGNLEVSIYHHSDNEEGRSLSENISYFFAEKGIRRSASNKPDYVFKDRNNLYLAKNALPAVSLVAIKKPNSKSTKGAIVVQLNEKQFTNSLTSGILRDYAQLEAED